MNKLPPELQLTVSREIVVDKWELDAVIKTVEREIDEQLQVCVWVGKKQSREPPTAATLLSTDPSLSCAYCDQAHHSSHCRVVTDVKLRKGMLNLPSLLLIWPSPNCTGSR